MPDNDGGCGDKTNIKCLEEDLTKGHENTCGGNRYVYHFDYGYGLVGLYHMRKPQIVHLTYV